MAHCAFKDICTHVHSAALSPGSKQVNQSCVFFFFCHLLHAIALLFPPRLFPAEGPFKPAAIILFRQLRVLLFFPYLSPKQVLCNTACARNHALLVMRLIFNLLCECFPSGLGKKKKPISNCKASSSIYTYEDSCIFVPI